MKSINPVFLDSMHITGAKLNPFIKFFLIKYRSSHIQHFIPNNNIGNKTSVCIHELS